jgi:hypothetical protein
MFTKPESFRSQLMAHVHGIEPSGKYCPTVGQYTGLLRLHTWFYCEPDTYPVRWADCVQSVPISGASPTGDGGSRGVVMRSRGLAVEAVAGVASQPIAVGFSTGC